MSDRSLVSTAPLASLTRDTAPMAGVTMASTDDTTAQDLPPPAEPPPAPEEPEIELESLELLSPHSSPGIVPPGEALSPVQRSAVLFERAPSRGPMVLSSSFSPSALEYSDVPMPPPPAEAGRCADGRTSP